MEIKDCGNDSDCENGGTCLGQPQKGQCLCPFGWTGQLCEGKSTWVVANDYNYFVKFGHENSDLLQSARSLMNEQIVS